MDDLSLEINRHGFFEETHFTFAYSPVPDASAHRGMDMKGTMAGMASPADMARLATLKGTDFDRLFLTLMIAHHDGALKMVDELVKKPGSAYDPVLFQFTSDVKTGPLRSSTLTGSEAWPLTKQFWLMVPVPLTPGNVVAGLPLL